MTTTETPVAVRDSWLPLVLTGALTAELGVLMLVWPGPSILVVAVVFGLYLLAPGIASVILGFSLHVSAANRVRLFVAGALLLILGVLAFRHFGQGYAAGVFSSDRSASSPAWS
jgi:uncharacterized membrane protein HdeD (DUF308 family)